jgi:diaminopimelate decarboxylase
MSLKKTRFEHFSVRQGRLFCEDIDLNDAIRTNKTPFYLYSAAALRHNYEKIRGAFAGVSPLVCYSIKVNGNLAIMKILKGLGSGFDIVSGGELFKCSRIRADMKKVVYAGVGKRDDEIEDALRAGILMFNCESVPEIERIGGIAARIGRKARIAVRINPDVDAGTHHYITTAKKENKFGVAFPDLERNLDMIRGQSWLELCGIHIHLGSQIVSAKPYGEAVRKGAQYIQALRKKGFTITHFNLGGGFGIDYDDGKVLSMADLSRTIVPRIKDLGVQLILEPGRYIAGNAGILVTQVLFVKRSGKKTFLITDAGMNNLIRPSLYGAYHGILPLEYPSGGSMQADVVGPICESGDFFAKDRTLPQIRERQYIAVMSAGAYGASMASRYNAQPFAAEILVDGRSIRVARKRESYKDMIRNEVY